MFIFQGKKGIWIKLPIELANLVEAVVKVKKNKFNLNFVTLVVLAWKL